MNVVPWKGLKPFWFSKCFLFQNTSYFYNALIFSMLPVVWKLLILITLLNFEIHRIFRKSPISTIICIFRMLSIFWKFSKSENVSLIQNVAAFWNVYSFACFNFQYAPSCRNTSNFQIGSNFKNTCFQNTSNFYGVFIFRMLWIFGTFPKSRNVSLIQNAEVSSNVKKLWFFEWL